MTTLNYIKKTESERYGLVDYFIVFWMIYASGIITFQYNNFTFLMIGTIVATACTFGTKILIEPKSKRAILIFALLECVALLQLIISVIDGHIYYGSLKMLLMFLFGIFCCLRFSTEKFFAIFSNIIVIIAAISVVLYWFNADIVASGVFPRVKTDEQTTYINLLVYCINTSIVHRNSGVFWEPGAFQIYLNLALLYVLHNTTLKRRGIKIAILIIALLTTISTMGYICAALILIAYFLRTDMKAKFKGLALVLTIFWALGSIILPIVIESFSYKFGLDGGGVSQNVTSRINPFLLDLHLISDNPIGLFGVDYYAEKLREYSMIYALPYVSSSCTITMVAAVYGLIPGLIVAYGVFLISRKFLNKKVNWILVVPLMLMFTTESFLTFPLYYYLAFMGYKEGKHSI